MAESILFLVPYPLNQSPSQRFRFEQYFEVLSKSGYVFTVQSFLTTENLSAFYDSKNLPHKICVVLLGFIKRLLGIFIAIKYNYIFIHREAAPFGPPIFEWIL